MWKERSSGRRQTLGTLCLDNHEDWCQSALVPRDGHRVGSSCRLGVLVVRRPLACLGGTKRSWGDLQRIRECWWEAAARRSRMERARRRKRAGPCLTAPASCVAACRERQGRELPWAWMDVYEITLARGQTGQIKLCRNLSFCLFVLGGSENFAAHLFFSCWFLFLFYFFFNANRSFASVVWPVNLVL